MKTYTRALLGLLIVLAGCDRGLAPIPSSPSTAATNAATTAPVGLASNAPPLEVTAPLQQATTLKAQGKLVEARDLLSSLAGNAGAPDQLLTILGDLNTQIVFSPAAAPQKVDHTIVTGDTLGKLAKKYGVTMELIKRANGLSRDMIRIGDRLRIYQGKFAVEVSKTANTLTVTDSGKFFKRYRVGTGQYSKTPVGEFNITGRIAQPPWYRTDGSTVPYGHPDNILGTHWLGLNVRGYGLHGTWETNSIGKQSSAGCIRLLNDDVAELYVLLPEGTPVTIHD
jgi:lipoprotein-anchoring transpeptidase ErfK/SrfK